MKKRDQTYQLAQERYAEMGGDSDWGALRKGGLTPPAPVISTTCLSNRIIVADPQDFAPLVCFLAGMVYYCASQSQ